MASGFQAAATTACERKVANGTDFTPPVTWYVGAFKGVAGAGGEVSGTGYARLAYTRNTTNFPNASPLVNGTAIDFAPITSAGGDVTSLRFFDSPSGGVEWMRSADFAPITWGANAALHVAAGNCTISVVGT